MVLLVIRIREKLDFHKFVKTPITKEVDDLENCHFRTLYKPTFIAFADNYTDPDFLCSMRLNTNLSYYSLGEAIQAAARVMLYLCPCILYFIMYYHLSHGNISPEMVFLISFCCITSGYGIYQVKRIQEENDKLSLSFMEATKIAMKMVPASSDCKVFLCCGALSYPLVPILRTLTVTMDVTSVHAVCTFMFAVHLLTNNYGLRVAGVVSKTLSMNSAIFSMICLSSRLQSDNHCLALLIFGGLSFVCYPEFSKLLWKWRPASWIAILVGAGACFTVSLRVLLFFNLTLLIVIVSSPAFYVYCVQYKLNIWGPWDEATLDLNVNMDEIEKGFEKRKQQPRSSKADSGNVWGESPDRNIAELEAKGIGLVL